MPFDQKRINGPESFAYKQFVENEHEAQRDGFEGKRVDGRQMDEHRKFGKVDNLIIAVKVIHKLLYFSSSVRRHF